MTLALTGVTGALGALVATQLADLQPILLARDISRVSPVAGQEVRQMSYADRLASLAALAGVDTLFMVSGAESPTRREEHRTFIEAAADAGVGHIVYTSFAGAAPDATFTLGRDHYDAEATIRHTGMTFTFLRDNFYADFVPVFADADGVVRGPAGDGRVAFVGRRDVADVAVAVLRRPAVHADATYTLTGPNALTLTEALVIASDVLGREFRFVDETVEEAYAWRKEQYGAEDWQLDAWVSTYTAIKDGSVSAVSDDVERVTGHPARILEQVLRGD